MSGIITLLVKFFQFILELILDIICTCLLIASLAWIFRWPFLGAGFTIQNRWDYRTMCAVNFGAMLLDILTLALVFPPLFTWRFLSTGFVLRQWPNIFDERYYAVEWRLSVLEQFGRWLIDIPFVIMVAITHACFWRIPFFWMDIAEETKKHGAPLACIDTEKESYGRKFRSNAETDHRKIIFMNFISAVIDIFLIPVLVVLAISVYRIPVAYKEVNDTEAMLSKKAVLVKHAVLVFFDIPFFIMGFLTCILLWRTKAFVEDWQEIPVDATSGGELDVKCCGDRAHERRMLAFRHFASTIRDILCMPFFIPVLLSLYRGFFAITAISQAISRWADDTPRIDVTRGTFVIPERGTGIMLRIIGTKDADFHIPEGKNVKLFIRNKEFWSHVGDHFGGATASLGPTMLPMQLNPRFMDPVVALPRGSTSVDFVIDFNTHYRTDTIFDNASIFDSHELVQIQVEYGNHEGTLFNAVVFPQQLRTMANEGVEVHFAKNQNAPPETMKGERLCDCFWRIALVQFGLLMLDIVALVFLVLLHLIPHRIYRVYSQGCEGPRRKTARKVWKMAKEAAELVDQTRSLRHAGSISLWV